jgi:hypothetical protein
MRCASVLFTCLLVGFTVFIPASPIAALSNQNKVAPRVKVAAQNFVTLGTEQSPVTVRVLPQAVSATEIARLERERTEKAESDAKLVNYTAMLALFTFVLAVSTIGLWLATKGLLDFAAVQAQDMKSSIAIAKQSADAALAVANSSVAVELPIFIVESVNFEPRASQATVSIGNHGRTPAIVMAESLILMETQILHDPPLYPTIIRPYRPRIVDPKHVYELKLISGITEEGWQGILKRETNLWIFGYVEYIDFLNIKRRDGFCFIFEPRFNSMYPTMLPSDGEWIRGGPPSYTFLSRPSIQDKDQTNLN